MSSLCCSFDDEAPVDEIYSFEISHKAWIHQAQMPHIYRQTSNVSHTLIGKKIVDHSDVVRALPVGDVKYNHQIWSSGSHVIQ